MVGCGRRDGMSSGGFTDLSKVKTTVRMLPPFSHLEAFKRFPEKSKCRKPRLLNAGLDHVLRLKSSGFSRAAWRLWNLALEKDPGAGGAVIPCERCGRRQFPSLGAQGIQFARLVRIAQEARLVLPMLRAHCASEAGRREQQRSKPPECGFRGHAALLLEAEDASAFLTHLALGIRGQVRVDELVYL